MTENLSLEPKVKQEEQKVIAKLSSKFVNNINVVMYDDKDPWIIQFIIWRYPEAVNKVFNIAEMIEIFHLKSNG